MNARSRDLYVLALVSAGGALGSLGRYGLSVAWPRGPESIPISTLVVNVSGSLLLGVLVAWRPDSPRLRAFLGIGVLGGFTTFSAFALETDRLLARTPIVALAYLALTLAGGLGAAALGIRLGGGSPRVTEKTP